MFFGHLLKKILDICSTIVLFSDFKKAQKQEFFWGDRRNGYIHRHNTIQTHP